eukprot:1033414-Pelagomonas_calceolata.AAC.4
MHGCTLVNSTTASPHPQNTGAADICSDMSDLASGRPSPVGKSAAFLQTRVRSPGSLPSMFLQK